MEAKKQEELDVFLHELKHDIRSKQFKTLSKQLKQQAKALDEELEKVMRERDVRDWTFKKFTDDSDIDQAMREHNLQKWQDLTRKKVNIDRLLRLSNFDPVRFCEEMAGEYAAEQLMKVYDEELSRVAINEINEQEKQKAKQLKQAQLKQQKKQQQEVPAENKTEFEFVPTPTERNVTKNKTTEIKTKQKQLVTKAIIGKIKERIRTPKAEKALLHKKQRVL